MSKEPSKIISDPIFEEALALAKGLAGKINTNTLTPVIMLAGIFLVIQNKKNDLPELFDRLDAIGSAISAVGLKLPAEIIPLSDKKMQLSDQLRKLVSTKGDSFLQFFNALFEAVETASSIKSHDYAQMLAYASCISEKSKFELVTPKILSAAAYIAFGQGRLSTNQALASFFNTNFTPFELLIEETGIDRDVCPPTDQTLLPISEEITSALATDGSDGERLFAALNVGLQSAQLLLSERATAYHEAGHAVVSATLRPSLAVTKLTIVPKDNADGTTVFDASSPYWRQSLTLEDLQTILATALAGRAAQLIKFGERQIDVGASSDIEGATSIAWKGIALSGLDPELGPINLEIISKMQGGSSGWIFDLAQRRIQMTLCEAAKRAENVLRANWSQVESVAKELLEKKDLSEKDFADKIIEKNLSGEIRAKRAKSRPTSRTVSFATHPGILQTPEGPVRYYEGDAIISEDNGSRWPVAKAYFEQFYEPNEGTSRGSSGKYHKARQDVLALELLEDKRLDLPNGRGILYGKTGDWVIDYGDGELSIVSKDQFFSLYELHENDP